MDRLIKTEFPSLKACNKCVEFDECMQKQCIQVYDALLKLKHYEDLESQLQKVYGECDGLLEEIQKYREIGTVEELREAREKRRAKNPINKRYEEEDFEYVGGCPCCGNIVGEEWTYCFKCGQHLDWSKS